MDPMTLALLAGAYFLGRRAGAEAPAGPPPPPPLPEAGPPPLLSASDQAAMTEESRGRRFRRAAEALLRERLAVASLERVAGPDDLLVCRLVPLGRSSAHDAVLAAHGRGAVVFVSLSATLPPTTAAERLVVFALARSSPTREQVARSPSFARLDPALPAAAPAVVASVANGAPSPSPATPAPLVVDVKPG